MKNLSAVLITIATSAFFSPLHAQELPQDKGTVGYMDSMEKRIEMESQASRLAQIMLEKKRAEDALKEDKFVAILQQQERELRASFKTREDELLSQIRVLQAKLDEFEAASENNASTHKESVAGIGDSLYVTSISGRGVNLIATIYFNEAIAKVSEGASLNDKVTVSSVMSNGIVIEGEGESVFIPITNEDYAFSQTFNKSALEALKSQGTSQGIRR